jgi:hypothetical protein
MRGSISGLARQQLSLGNAGQPPRNPALQAGTPRSVAGTGASFYPTPAFQNHAEHLGKSNALLFQESQLELTRMPIDRDYDNQADMVDDSEIETPSGHGGFGTAFNSDTTQPMLLSPTSTGPAHHEQGGHQASLSNHNFPFPSMTQLLDHQTMDWDPFGLSASMAFPSQQFPFDQTSMR